MFVIHLKGPLKSERWLIALSSGFVLTSSIDTATRYPSQASAREDLRRARECEALYVERGGGEPTPAAAGIPGEFRSAANALRRSRGVPPGGGGFALRPTRRLSNAEVSTCLPRPFLTVTRDRVFAGGGDSRGEASTTT